MCKRGDCLRKTIMISAVEIVCHADVDRNENPEYEEIAAMNCNENRDTRQQAIEELRSMIISRGQCHPLRMDDAYLLKFLRCRGFIPALAHKLIIRYEDYRKRSAQLYDCDLFELSRVSGVLSGILPEGPNCGRVIVMKFGRWDIDRIDLVDLARASLVTAEIASQVPRLQILGASAIIDLEGYGLRHFSYFSPTAAYQLVSLLGVNFPFLYHGVHFVNYNWILTSLLFIAKQFMPKAAFRFIHLHGRDMSSLHKYIDPACLPKEYGGHAQHVIAFEDWLSCIKKYITRDESLVREFTNLGFTINMEKEK